MSLPDSSSTSSLPPAPIWPEDVVQAQQAGPTITALSGNRAALTLLLTQNIVSVLLAGSYIQLGHRLVRIGLGWPLGMSLLGSFVVTAALAFALFRPSLQALAADSRWRTPPQIGLALGAFGLSFLASRAFAAAYVALVPSAASTVPQFLSHGADLAVLVLAAGLLIPFAEEVAFRGLMMRGQERAAGFGVAAVATSFAFAIAHGVPASIAGILPLAYILARVVQHTGSLWNSVIIHALNNLLSVGLGVYLAGHNLGSSSNALNGDTADLVKNEALRLPVAGGAVLFGTALMVIAHYWLTPKADRTARSVPGPWVSGAYVAIILFGLWSILSGLPIHKQLVNSLQHVLHLK